MTPRRLTDEDLMYWLRDPSEMDGEHLPELLEELIELRAASSKPTGAGMTEGEHSALSGLLDWCKLDGHAPSSTTGRERYYVALAVLERLLGKEGG